VDVIVSLDAGAKSRLGMPDHLFDGRTLINIEHHASNSHFGDINVVNIKASATGVIVYDLIRENGLPVSSAVAQAIYATILTDTGSFRQSNTTAEIHEMAAALIRAGADPWLVARSIYESNTRSRLDLLGMCLDTLETHDGGRSAWLHVDGAMYEKSGGVEEDTEGLIEFGRSLDGVEVAVFIRPGNNGAWKVSFRGKVEADVGTLAANLGGGGHRHASGCTLKGSFGQVRDQVRQAVSALLAT
jgi:phosphoesterase RecJ-like protein